MSSERLFWERVNAALDDRRDPLDDAGIQAQLADSPELLEPLMVLRERLSALPHAARHPATRSTWQRRAAAAAALALLASAGWLALRGRSPAPQPLPELRISVSGDAARANVLSFRATFVEDDGRTRTTTVVDPLNSTLQRSQLQLAPVVSSIHPGVVALASSVSVRGELR